VRERCLTIMACEVSPARAFETRPDIRRFPKRPYRALTEFVGFETASANRPHCVTTGHEHTAILESNHEYPICFGGEGHLARPFWTGDPAFCAGLSHQPAAAWPRVSDARIRENFREPLYTCPISYRPMNLAATFFIISLVPANMDITRTSLQARSIGYSSQ